MKRRTSRKAAPKEVKVPKKEYASFDEFLRATFPSDLKNQRAAKTTDPFEFGAEMAKKSSIKLEKFLSSRNP